MMLPDLLGLVGVFITLVAYFLLNTRKISAEKYTFPVLNAIGSVLILYSLFFEWNISAFIMEICWLLISCYGVWQVMRNNKVVLSKK
jgi:drug/metabolite transporter superfamily protein YnfA